MAIHIKDIKQAITLIKETQTSLNRLSKMVTNEDIRTLSKKVNKFLDEIEVDVYSGWDTKRIQVNENSIWNKQ